MKITPLLITTEVCETTECPHDSLLKKSRRRIYVQSRQISAYLIRNEFGSNKYNKDGLSLKNIADILGLKNHATVLHSIKTVENEMQTSKSFWMLVKSIEENINNKRKSDQIFAMAI